MLLVHVTTGSENPTKAALAFTVAKSAVDAGHEVVMFLAGDAAVLLRDAVLDNLVGLGTGSLREAFNGLQQKGVRFYISGQSAKARGVTEADLAGKNAEFSGPPRLLELLFAAERSIHY